MSSVRLNRSSQSKRSLREGRSAKNEEARIVDAVKDQDGRYWIRYGTTTKSAWFALEELHLCPAQVFSRLTGPGTTFLTAAAQTKFKERVERHQEYREALVAGRPGWLANHYVFADGTVQSPSGDKTEIIIAFRADQRFSQSGSIGAWRREMGAFVEGQPLALFALSYAFVGPLLRFAPPDYMNPQVELVGRRESGKSTLLVAAQSVWGGTLACDVGACETWDLTIAALDEMKLIRADGFLTLDEGNLAGSTSRQQKEIITTSIFKMAGTGRKKRHGDVRPGHQARVAMMSTTNRSLAEHVGFQGPEAGALRSRMLTIQIDDNSPLGIFAFVPRGCSTSREASELLRKAANENFGAAAREFIRHMVKDISDDEAAFGHEVERLLKSYFKKRLPGDSARIGKTFALTALAGSLACKWGVLPFERMEVISAVRQLHRTICSSGEAEPGRAALDRILSYAERYDEELIEEPKKPLDSEEFGAASGFRRKYRDRVEILIPSLRFQREFPDYRDLMRELMAAGLARVEKGKQTKLTIKCPTALCATGRVYCIVLPSTKE